MKLNRFIPGPGLISYLITSFIVIFVFLTTPDAIGFNSDAVYLPALFSDVFLQGHSFFSWKLTPAPYFFPDMLVFFIINTFVHNVFYVFIIYAVFQNLLLLFLISQITFIATKNKTLVLLAHIIFLVILTLAYGGNFWVYNSSMCSAHHFGTIINGLLLLYFLMLYGNKPRLVVLLCIFSLVMLSIASDLLFVMQFFLPILAAIVFCSILKINVFNLTKKIFFWLIVFALIGFSVKYFLSIGNSNNYILSHTLGAAGVASEFLLIFKKTWTSSSVLGLSIMVFYIAMIIKCLKELAFRKSLSSMSKQQAYVFFVSFFVVTSVVFSLGGLMINGVLSARYTLNFYWFPVVFSWVLFEKKMNKKVLLVILYASSVAAIASKILLHLPYKTHHALELVNCIDEHINKYNDSHSEKIKYGISDYWDAKLVTTFSKSGLLIAQFTPNLVPNIWITTTEIYRDHYDFSIITTNRPVHVIDRGLLMSINGKPAEEFFCGEYTSVLIYGKNRLSVSEAEEK